jgi:VWFA-related protein
MAARTVRFHDLILPSLILLATGTCVAQDKAEITSGPATAVFKSSTNLVQIPVVVRDNSGHAVGTLGVDDFQLLDNGKPQVISRFSVEKFESTETRSQAKGQSAGPARGSGQATAAAAAPNTIPDRFVALLIDDVNLEPAEFIPARSAVLHFIASMRGEERASVVTASGKGSTDFTNDRDALHAAVLHLNSQGRKKFYDSVTDEKHNPCPLSPFVADRIVNSGDIQIGCRDEGIVRAQAADLLARYGDPDNLSYFEALRNTITKMSAMPGQRAILLASPGMYVPKRYSRQLTGVLAEAIRAKVVISGIDPRGVRISTAEAGSKFQQGQSELERQAFMEDITAGTGGRYFRGNNDMDGLLEQADGVPEYIYLLAFSPSNLKFDGSRHQLKITLKNGRGYKIQARDGYFADGYSEDPADQVKQQIQDAFFSNQDLNGLPVQLQTQFFKDGNNTTLTANVRVDPSKLPFKKEDGRNRDDLTMVIGVFDQNGNFVAAFQKIIEMRLKDETLSQWMKSGIENSTDFDIKPGRYLVRLVVRDSEGSSMAEQSTGVEIPW